MAQLEQQVERHPVTQRLCLLTLCTLLLGGCQGVDVEFNEQVFYTSADLFTQYDIPDPGLKGCIERTILEHRLTAAGQLRDLHCIEAGVTTLDGLHQFPALERLDLTGNYELPCAELEKVADVAALILPQQCQ